jgi:hypothetical protein
MGPSSQNAYLSGPFLRGCLTANRYDGPPNNDIAYYKNIYLLNDRLASDMCLQCYLNVQPDLWLNELDSGTAELRRTVLSRLSVGPRKRSLTPQPSEQCQDSFCAAAVNKLRSLSGCCTAHEKLKVIVDTIELLTQFCSARTGKTWPAETGQLLDVLQFVLVRAQVPHFSAELHFIQDFSTHPINEEMLEITADFGTRLMGFEENVCGFDPHMMSFLLTSLSAAYQVLRDGLN